MYISIRRTREQEQPNSEIWCKMEPLQTLKEVSVHVETMLNSANQSRWVFLTLAYRLINENVFEPRKIAEYHTNGHIIVSDESESSDDGIDTDCSNSDSDMEID